MAILEIPVRSDLSSYEFVVELDRRNYLLGFRWNTRTSQWFMDISKTDGTAVLAGVPLLVGVELIDRFQSDDRPPGRMLVFDKSRSGDEPGRNNLGTDFLLLYREAT